MPRTRRNEVINITNNHTTPTIFSSELSLSIAHRHNNNSAQPPHGPVPASRRAGDRARGTSSRLNLHIGRSIAPTSSTARAWAAGGRAVATRSTIGSGGGYAGHNALLSSARPLDINSTALNGGIPLHSVKPSIECFNHANQLLHASTALRLGRTFRFHMLLRDTFAISFHNRDDSHSIGRQAGMLCKLGHGPVSTSLIKHESHIG
mmetsp:Transcript_27920/g.57903  ORF Transcript_27920/g.57903 Transcript_27920/m.57903 type:complete len:206 (+) Transcript_27920:3525-4142(+)